MDQLRDKAAGSVDAERASDLDGEYRIESPALYSADEVTAEDEYPEYGDWLRTEDGGYVECPTGLAAVIVEGLDADHSGPFTLIVDDVNKAHDGDAAEFLFTAEATDES